MPRKRTKKKPDIAHRQAAASRAKKNAAMRANSPNAKIIHNLMISEKVNGDFKDYVVLVGKRLVDWQGSYDMIREADGKSVGVDGMALVHKSKLAPVIGDELAKHFWRPGIGRVFHGGNS